jgi:hypothetical protein
VLEQQKPDHQLRVFARTSDIGKRLPVLILKILPGDDLGDPKPAVSCIELAPERKKFGKKKPAAVVFRAIHGCGLLREMHGFRALNSVFRALEALNLPKIYHRTIL